MRDWAKLNARLGWAWSKPGIRDLPWWYNERALLSVLVGAIWRTGGDAFEEFTETKLSPKKKGREANGRIDLWFETSGGEYRAEVKHEEISITRNAHRVERLKDLMKRAVIDARRNLSDRGASHRLAIAFAVPYLKTSVSDKIRKEKVNEFIACLDELERDAIAWVFPGIKNLPSPHGWVCPGIVVWIKIVRRS